MSFQRIALLLIPLSLRAATGAGAAAVGDDTLRVVVVLSADTTSPRATATLRGTALGAEEATRTAALFGLTMEVLYERVAADGPTTRALNRLADRLDDRRPVAVVGGVDNPTCDSLAALARERSIAFVGLECAQANAVHRAGSACQRFVFSMRPADSTRLRARAAHAARPTRTAADGAASAMVALWHHTLSRFGAAQLNDRFRRRFAAEMDSDAWAGWMAMKTLAEAALRARSTAPDRLARYLARPTSRFDGHKGEPLSFDAATGELRQPLYVVAGDGHGGSRVLAELSTADVFGRRRPPADGHDEATCIGVSRGDRT